MVLDPSFLNAVNTNILPATDNEYDLGSSSYRWRNLYLAGALTVPTANVSMLQVGGVTVIDSSRNLQNIVTETLVGLTDDPSIAAGKLWFRSDLKQIRWSPDGSAVKQVYPADWGDITNKPSAFPPSPHTHSRGDITNFWSIPFWDNIPDKPSTFPPSAHASSHRPGGSDALFPANYNLLPLSDNTYDLGSSSYRWRNLYLAGAANVGSLQVLGVTVIDSSRNLVNASSVQSRLLSPGAVFLLAQPHDADSTITLRSSPDIVLRGKYWTGSASANFDASLRHVMLSTTPTSKLSFMFGGYEKAYIDSAGNMNIGSLLIGGTTVIDSSRNWVSGVIRRDTGQEIFRCLNDTPQRFTFTLRNSSGTFPVDHIFAPADKYYGYIGNYDYPWHMVSAVNLIGDVVLPLDGNNSGWLGLSNQKWAYLYAVYKSAAFKHPLHNPEKYIVFRAVEGPKVTVEDWGVAELRDGVAFVTFSEEYAATISDTREYAVFLTPEGPCNGLYVSRKEPHGFEVRELGGGKSNVRFSWLVKAIRVGDEDTPVLEEPVPEFKSKEDKLKWREERRLADAKREEEREARIKRNIERYREVVQHRGGASRQS